MALSLAVTVQTIGVVTRSRGDVGGREPLGSDRVRTERLQEEGTTGLLSRSESTQERRTRRGAKLLNREKHLDRTGSESRGEAGKARESFVGRTRDSRYSELYP